MSGEVCAFAVACHGGRTVAAHGVGRKEVSVSVTAGGDNNGVCRETFKLTCHEVLGDDTACASVNHNHVVHFVAVEALYLAEFNLAVK